MPQNEKHQRWSMHLDLLPGVRERLTEFCVQLPALLCVEENGEETGKPHVHILFQLESPESAQTLGNRLKKYFKDTVLEKSHFSHSVWKDDGAIRYICKGPSKSVKTAPIVLYKNWLDDPLEWHEKYWKEHEIVVQKSQAYKKRGLTYNDSIVEDIIQEMKEENVRSECIFDVACQKLLRKKKGKINDHIAFPMIQAIEYHFTPNNVVDDFRMRMLKKKSNY